MILPRRIVKDCKFDDIQFKEEPLWICSHFMLAATKHISRILTVSTLTDGCQVVKELSYLICFCSYHSGQELEIVLVSTWHDWIGGTSDHGLTNNSL